MCWTCVYVWTFSVIKCSALCCSALVMHSAGSGKHPRFFVRSMQPNKGAVVKHIWHAVAGASPALIRGGTDRLKTDSTRPSKDCRSVAMLYIYTYSITLCRNDHRKRTKQPENQVYQTEKSLPRIIQEPPNRAFMDSLLPISIIMMISRSIGQNENTPSDL